jgi:hypothetical protein
MAEAEAVPVPNSAGIGSCSTARLRQRRPDDQRTADKERHGNLQHVVPLPLAQGSSSYGAPPPEFRRIQG